MVELCFSFFIFTLFPIYSSWSSWSDCDTKSRKHIRTRQGCGSNSSPVIETDSKRCSLETICKYPFPIATLLCTPGDDIWSDCRNGKQSRKTSFFVEVRGCQNWSDWSSCSKTCGGIGFKVRQSETDGSFEKSQWYRFKIIMVDIFYRIN